MAYHIYNYYISNVYKLAILYRLKFLFIFRINSIVNGNNDSKLFHGNEGTTCSIIKSKSAGLTPQN